MKIILLKDVAKVGKKYDVKDISEGYAQNLLIPKGLAVAATPDVLKRVELEKARDEGERKIRNELLLKNLSDLDGKTVTIIEKANDKGHLFAGIHKPEIIPAIEKQTQLQIDAEHMILEKPIKELGMHSIEVRVGNKSIKFNLDVRSK